MNATIITTHLPLTDTEELVAAKTLCLQLVILRADNLVAAALNSQSDNQMPPALGCNPYRNLSGRLSGCAVWQAKCRASDSRLIFPTGWSLFDTLAQAFSSLSPTPIW